ncbi:MAG: tRNA pseudouridine(38-40) synthase TruA [Alphaproteobacteria bacterium]
MTRFKITIEYDGAPFVGWQRQSNGYGVQQALEEAVEKLTGQFAQVQGAGRTDAGVHGLGQVAHFDCEKAFTAHKIRDGLNFHLKPNPISILAAEAVDDDFHARFSATKRHYVYRLVDRRAPPILRVGKVWHVPQPLNVDAMQEAAQRLTGRHDFTTFRSVHCQADNPVRTLDILNVERIGDEIEVRATALSFLHNQIRSFVGTLERVGQGKWTADDVEAALKACDRTRCGPVAPPQGLYFLRVDY